jgi:hippurate hydrolase
VLGEDRVIAREPIMGAEDFAEFGRTKEKVPLCLFWLGTQDPAKVTAAEASGETLPSLHSPFFLPVAEPTIRTGVTAMTAAAMGLMPKR